MFEHPVMSIKYPLIQECRTLSGPYKKLGGAFS